MIEARRAGLGIRARAWSVPIVVALVGIALSGCLGEPIDPGSTSDALPPGHDQHHDEATAPTGLGAPDVIIEAHAGMREDDLRLHPDTIEIPLGSVVEMRIANDGRTPHTFTIHEFDADTGVLQPGEERVVTFRADKAGTFETMCDSPGHYQAGMRGTIEVAA